VFVPFLALPVARNSQGLRESPKKTFAALLGGSSLVYDSRGDVL
jgi:hypothetical protein